MPDGPAPGDGPAALRGWLHVHRALRCGGNGPRACCACSASGRPAWLHELPRDLLERLEQAHDALERATRAAQQVAQVLDAPAKLACGPSQPPACFSASLSAIAPTPPTTRPALLASRAASPSE